MLRDYQAEIINDVRSAWAAGAKNALVALPCGGGKTVIAAEMARRVAEHGKRTLFLVHRRELIDQARRVFERENVPGGAVDFQMVQTLCRSPGKIEPPGLIIVDEAHHSLAKSYEKVCGAYPKARVIGITATPERMDGNGLGAIYDKLIVGPSVRSLIDQGYLADFDAYAPKIADLTGIRKRAGEFDQNEAGLRLSKANVLGDAVSHYQKIANGKQAILYATNIAHSKAMARSFAASGVSAAHLDGETPDEVRDRITRDFRDGKIRVLCNVDLIGEGFDVPDCECVILLRPTASRTVYVQQSMRAMRPKPGKRALILDHVGNILRFGLPDMEVSWSLGGKKKVKKEPKIRVRECPKCYRVYVPKRGQRACPFCGYEPEVERRTVRTNESATLEKIDAKTAIKRCASYRDFLELGRRLGYRPGWAYYQAKAKGFL